MNVAERRPAARGKMMGLRPRFCRSAKVLEQASWQAARATHPNTPEKTFQKLILSVNVACRRAPKKVAFFS